MIVDISFRMMGARLPADHSYRLYGALTTAVPELHGDKIPYSVHPVRGQQLPGRELALLPHSQLIVRLDHEHLPTVMPLAGKALRVGSYIVSLGVPGVHPLTASPVLRSRLVIIKGFTEPEAFRQAAQRQVEQAGVSATVGLVEPRANSRFEGRSTPATGPVRRTLRIRDKEIVGFAVQVDGLADHDAITLQERGLGGRQHFGCGVLVPPPSLPGVQPGVSRRRNT